MKKIAVLFLIAGLFLFSGCDYFEKPDCAAIKIDLSESNDNVKLINASSNYIRTYTDLTLTGSYFSPNGSYESIEFVSLVSTDESVIGEITVNKEEQTFTAKTLSQGEAQLKLTFNESHSVMTLPIKVITEY